MCRPSCAQNEARLVLPEENSRGPGLHQTCTQGVVQVGRGRLLLLCGRRRTWRLGSATAYDVLPGPPIEQVWLPKSP